MTDKKIIIAAIILAFLLVGGGWYYSSHRAPPPAKPQTSSVSEQGIAYGNPGAPLTIEEYTNFLCPACARAATSVLPQLEEEYVKTGKVKMIFYIYPPLELSEAAQCAQEQNKFIEYHNYLFSHQGQITGEKDIKDFAGNAGLDTNKFNSCYDSGKFKSIAEKWLSQGQARGVDSTPTFFIGGQKIVGAQPYSEIKKTIEDKLSQVK